MAFAAGFVAADTGVYAALQSAKGTPGTTVKGALAFTKCEITPTIEKIDGVPMLGAGFYMQKSLGYAVQVQVQAEGWVTLDTFPGLLFSGFATKGATTGTGPYTHPYSLITKNANKKYMTLAVVYGESSMGVGLRKVVVRDCVLTSLSFTFTSKDSVKWSATWMGLNMGPGPSLTFSFDNTFDIPNPNNTANTFTYPSFFGSNICATQANVSWSAQTVQSDPCFGSGEHADTLITQAGWKISFDYQYDSNIDPTLDQIWYKTASPTADTSQFKPGLKEGAYSFLFNSDNAISGGSTPYSLSFSWPSLQWAAPKVSNASPNVVSIEADSFGSDATISLVNNSTSTAMTY